MIEWISEYKEKYKKIEEDLSKKSNNISNIRGLVFILLIIFAIFAYNYPESNIYKVLSAACIIAFIFVALKHKKIISEKKQAEDFTAIAHEYEERLNGNWQNFEENGAEFLKDESIKGVNNYMRDLQILGENSLFQFLNVAHSVGGKRRLARTLSLEKIDKNYIVDNQNAINDLSSNIDFNLNFQANLKNVKNIEKTDLQSYFYIFEGETNFKYWDFALSGIFSLVTIFSLIMGVMGSISLMYFNIIFTLQLLISLIYLKIHSESFAKLSDAITVFSKLNKTYECVINNEFESDRNKQLKEDFRNGASVLKKIVILDNLDSLRKNIFSYMIFNTFFNINRFVMYKYHKLLKQDNSGFVDSIKAIEKFEALLSLTTVNLIKTKICKPEIVDDLKIECKELIYPLLSEDVCISNDFAGGADINIITGSNMSGKTSFMRAIGVNMILAYCGSYVNASKFVIPIMNPFTSINVKDDISKGISTFYGELLRIKEILDFSKNSDETMIVFIDEIFKGTNYADRIFGAKRVIENLSEINCIVFLTTHDFELCEMENSKVKNYHFSEEYVDGKMVFSHKIKTGQCESTNAKELMKEIGIV